MKKYLQEHIIIFFCLVALCFGFLGFLVGRLGSWNGVKVEWVQVSISLLVGIGTLGTFWLLVKDRFQSLKMIESDKKYCMDICQQIAGTAKIGLNSNWKDKAGPTVGFMEIEFPALKRLVKKLKGEEFNDELLAVERAVDEYKNNFQSYEDESSGTMVKIDPDGSGMLTYILSVMYDIENGIRTN